MTNTDAVLSAEDGAKLAALPDPTEARVEAQEPPITIYLTTGQAFDVPNEHSWGYLDAGIFATGRFRWQNAEDVAKDVLFIYENILYIEFDFNAVDDVQAAEAQDAAA